MQQSIATTITTMTLAILAALASLSACAGNQPHQLTLGPALTELSRAKPQPTTFIGEGRLSHAPEYIELTVSIHAECHATPMAANKAADSAAVAVMELLRGVLDAENPKDGVFSKGGYSRPFSRYENGRTVCRGTFAKTSTVTVKTSRIAEFAARYPEIQEQVLLKSLRQPSNPAAGKPTTYATLSNPEPRLYYETRERLEQKALADALVNAREKFETTATAGCGSRSYGIARVVETRVDGGRPIAYGRSQPSPTGTRSALELDAIWINKLLEVSFSTEPATCVPLGTTPRK